MKIDLCVFLILFYLFSIHYSINAQEKGFVSYLFKDNGSEKTMHLYFDSVQSWCTYNRFDLDKDLGIAEMNLNSQDQRFSLSIKQYDSTGIVVYRNLAEKLLLIRYPKVSVLSPFLVKDNWLVHNWTISKKRKNIMGYSCVKATTNFRGRNYVVWFAPDLKFSYGPWKLFGLPGVILHAYDQTRMFEWKIKALNFNVDTLIERPHEDNTKNIKEFVSYLDHQLEIIYENIKYNAKKRNKTLPAEQQITVSGFQRYTSIAWGRKKSLEVVYEFEKVSPKHTEINSNNTHKMDSVRYYNYDR